MNLKQIFFENEMRHSAGVLLTNGEHFLVVHPTGSEVGYWEIPKGLIDSGEAPQQTAVREFAEEVGVKIDIAGLELMETFQLHESKKVTMFRYMVETLPPIKSMKCASTFTPNYRDPSKQEPEVDGWKYITLQQIGLVRYEMQDAVKRAMTSIDRSKKKK